MKIRLFLNYYIDPDATRAAEIALALNNNLINPHFDKIYTLAEAHVPATVTIIFAGRPTFADLFKEANTVIHPGDITIIANSDIYFTATLSLLNIMQPGEAFALSRTDNLSRDSQDAWIFRGKIRNVGADFCPGVPGCDNRLAYELDKAGYQVSNPSRSIHAVHVHSSQVRNYDQDTPKVDRPYLLLTPCLIGQQSPKDFIM